MKLLIMQFPPISCHFISLLFKFSHQYPVISSGNKRGETSGHFRLNFRWVHALQKPVPEGLQTYLIGFFFNSGLWGYWHYGHSWPIVPASGDSEDDCGEADGM
jgi:hypothetical protein